MKKRSAIISVSLLAASLLLSACLAPMPKTTGTNTPISEITAAATQAAATSIPTIVNAGFPVSGEWGGIAKNGATTMLVKISIQPECNIGEKCATFDLTTISCAGSFTLVNQIGNEYEFQVGDIEGACGKGRDFLTPQEDSSLLYRSTGDYGETAGTLYPVLPVIYDDDGSPDGSVALMYLLSDPRVDVKAVNISYGEADPEVYIQYIGGLLEDLGHTSIPLGAGKSHPLEGNNMFPDALRQYSGNFWGQPIPHQGKKYAVSDAAQLIVNTVNNSVEPITIFISGPCTNLAEALRLDAGIKDKIKSVYIMGGAVYVSGNLSDLVPNPENTSAEWNIYGDPVAADEVFNSGLDIYLVPLDATNLARIDQNDIQKWKMGANAAQFAASLYGGMVGNGTFAIWDIMTAEIMVNPALCEFTDLNLKVETTPGIRNGQTRVYVELPRNIHTCLKPNVGEIVGQLDVVLANSR